jgi:large subunit ribosomal protein L32
MPVPKRKRSKSRRDKRFANKGLEVKSFSTCSNCSTALTGHHACTNCGFYKGRKIFATKLDRKLKRNEDRSKKQVAAQARTTRQQASADQPEVIDSK